MSLRDLAAELRRLAAKAADESRTYPESLTGVALLRLAHNLGNEATAMEARATESGQ